MVIRKHYHSSFEINICENVKDYMNVGLNLFPFLDDLEIENYLKKNYPPFILKNPCKKRMEEYLDLLISEKGLKQASTLL